MINLALRDHLDKEFPGLVLFESPCFDGSIVGFTADYQRLIYDYEKMVEEYAEDNCCTEEEAEEFIQYNTLNSLSFPGAPVVLMSSQEVLEV